MEGKIRFSEHVINQIHNKEFDVVTCPDLDGDHLILTNKDRFGFSDRRANAITPHSWIAGPKYSDDEGFEIYASLIGWPWNKKKKALMRRGRHNLENLTQEEHDALYDVYKEMIDLFHNVVAPKCRQDIADKKESLHWWP